MPTYTTRQIYPELEALREAIRNEYLSSDFEVKPREAAEAYIKLHRSNLSRWLHPILVDEDSAVKLSGQANHNAFDIATQLLLQYLMPYVYEDDAVQGVIRDRNHSGTLPVARSGCRV